MNSRLARTLFMAGARRRNPSLLEEYERVRKSEWLTRNQLEQLQLDRAARFLSFVEKHSPYFQRIFHERGFTAQKFSAISDLRVLPPIEKATLITNNREIHTAFAFPRVFLAETSGTTGSALEFRKNERWDSTNRAYLMRAYDWYGVKPWDRNGYLWGYDIAPNRAMKVRFMDLLQNRFRVFRYDERSMRAFAKALGSAAYVGGYSSMIYETARIINQLGLPKPRLKMVKGTSEMILDVYRSETEKAFGRAIVSEYGAAEAGLIAFECPSGRMHINMEDVIVEVEGGDILVTNLASYSFPVIRYRLGDSVTMLEQRCPCERQHPIIGEVVGRRGATVVGRAGRYPALTFYYVFKNLALQRSVLLNYKAVQEAPAIVTIDIEGRANRRVEPLITTELKKYFGHDVEFEIRFVESFAHNKKKAQYFESRLASQPASAP